MEYSNTAYQPPDLASVLRTLSALAPAQGQAPHQQPFPYQSEAHPKDDELEEGEYDPADDYSPSEPLPPPPQPPHQPQSTSPLPTISSHALPPTPPSLQPPTKVNPTSQTQPQPQPLPPPTPSPSTTTTLPTYPRALHHILHLTTTSPTFLPTIHTLLTTQHRHEREWHAQRLALQARLASRKEKRSQLDDVLAALGGKVSGKGRGGRVGGVEGVEGSGGVGGEKEDEEEKREQERELGLFDRKVWKAQREMVRAMGREVVGLLEDLCAGEGEMK